MKTISKKNVTLDDSMEDHLRKVNDVIRSSLDSEVPLINQVGKHIIDGGGKKMRPQCLLNLAGLAGGIKDIHYQLAAIVEFIHTATLLHDDVVDGSDTRRSSPTANIKFGNSASILVGDFIYSRSFQMMVELDNIEIMDILAYTTNKIAEGEVLQLINKNNFDISQEDYFKVIQAKTGVLFEACGKLASISNECSFNQKNSLSTIGEIFGQIYQLIDDMLDYSGDAAKIGKNLGDDLKDGKISINHGDLSQLTKIISIINKTNAIESVKEIIITKYAELDHKISNFNDSAYKDQIMKFISKSIHRDF
ncbi:MAG: octaprenyl diphosphate synthase [Betaproteobacteria bacterium]|nr:octaprenyl diphosphate synthase [Betaproteobacteria bacterium]